MSPIGSSSLETLESRWMDSYVESSVLSFNSSASQVSAALSLIPTVGLVSVSKVRGNEAFNGSFESTWKITFLTHGGDVRPLVALWNGGSTDQSYATTCTSCARFDSPAHVSVAELVRGTEPVSGSWRLKLGTGTGMGSDESSPVAASATGFDVVSALQVLPGVYNAHAERLDCAMEGTCVWLISLWHVLGTLPHLSVISSELRGSDVRAFHVTVSQGAAITSGNLQFQVIDSNEVAHSEVLPLSALSSSESSAVNLVRNSIRSLCVGCIVDVTASSFTSSSGDRNSTKFLISYSSTRQGTISNDLKYGEDLERSSIKISDIPSLDMVVTNVSGSAATITLTEVTADGLTSRGHRMWLLALELPERNVISTNPLFVSEIQEIHVEGEPAALSAGVLMLGFESRMRALAVYADCNQIQETLSALVQDDLTVTCQYPATGKLLWRITFSSTFGRARLITAKAMCNRNMIDSQSTDVPFDYWRSTSRQRVCSGSMSLLVTTRRIAIGSSPISGLLQITVRPNPFSPAVKQWINVRRFSYSLRLFLMAQLSLNSSDIAVKSLELVSDESKDGFNAVRVLVDLQTSTVSEMSVDASGLEVVSGTFLEGSNISTVAGQNATLVYSLLDAYESGIIEVIPRCSDLKSYISSYLCRLSLSVDGRCTFMSSGLQWSGTEDELSDVLAELVYVAGVDSETASFRGGSILLDRVDILAERTLGAPPSGTSLSVDLETSISVSEALKLSFPTLDYYTLEDRPLSLGDIHLSFPDHSSIWSTIGSSMWVQATVTTAVGSVSIADNAYLMYATPLEGRNVTFAGTVLDVDRALSSLIYTPKENWNSVLGSSSPTIQRLRLSRGGQKVVFAVQAQILNETKCNHDNCHFTISLDCGKWIRKEIDDITGVNISSIPLSANASEAAVEESVDKLLIECLSMNSLPNNLSYHTKSIVLKTSVVDSLGRHTNTWKVYLLDSDISTVPSLQAHPILASMGSLSLSVTSESVKLPGKGSYQLGFGGEWTTVLTSSSSTADIEVTLEELTVINDVTVSLSSSLSYGADDVAYDITFEQLSDWGSSSQHTDAYLSPSKSYAYMPTEPLQVRIFEDSTLLSVYVESLGTAQHDTIAISVCSLTRSSWEESAGRDSVILNRSISMFVLPVDDVPAIEIPFESIVVQEDRSFSVEGVHLVDVDIERAPDEKQNKVHNKFLFVGISHVHASIAIPSPPSSLTLNSTFQFTVVSGSLNDINAALSLISYAPYPDFYGSTYIEFCLLTGKATSCSQFPGKTKSIAVEVMSEPDPLRVTTSTTQLICMSGKAASLVDINIRDPDCLDSNTCSSIDFTMTLEGDGVFHVPILKRLSASEHVALKWLEQKDVHLFGTLSSVHTMYRHLKFRGGRNENDTLRITVARTDGNPGTTRIEVSAFVVQQAAPLAITSPSKQVAILEDHPWRFENVSVGFSLFPQSSIYAEVMVSAELGSVSISSSAPFLDTVVLSTGLLLHLRGRKSSVNMALAAAVYTPPSDWYGTTVLTVSALEDPLTASPRAVAIDIVIVVLPLDDPPSIHIKPSIAASRTLTTTRSMSLGSFYVTDADGDDGLVQVKAWSTGGLVRLPTSADFLLLNSTMINGVIFIADMAKVSDVLNSITYTPPAGYTGIVNVSFLLTSLKNTVGSESLTSPYELGLFSSASMELSVRTRPNLKFDCMNSVDIVEDDSFVISKACSLISVGATATAHSQQAVTLRLNTTIGTLSLENIGSAVSWMDVVEQHYFDDTSSLELRCSLQNIPKLFDRIRFSPPRDYHGSASLMLVATHDSSETADNFDSKSSFVLNVNVLSVDDSPQIVVTDSSMNLSSPLILRQSDTLLITFISIVDVDSANRRQVFSADTHQPLVTMEVRMEKGRCSLMNGTALALLDAIETPKHRRADSLLLRGTVTDLSLLLSEGGIGCVYSANEYAWANEKSILDRLAINVNKTIQRENMQRVLSTSKYFDILIEIDNMSSVEVIVPTQAVIGTEDTPLHFGGNISIRSKNKIADDLFTLKLFSNDGLVSINGILPSNVKSSYEHSTFVLYGPLSSLQTTLSSLLFSPNPNRCKEVTIEILLTPQAKAEEYVAKLVIFLMPVNDPPTVTWDNSSFIATQGDSLSLAAVGWNLNDVDVVDVAGESVVAELHVSCGIFSFRHSAMVSLMSLHTITTQLASLPQFCNRSDSRASYLASVQHNGARDESNVVRLTGSCAAVTAALAAVVYHIPAGAEGEVLLNLRVYDREMVRPGDKPSIESVISVTVTMAPILPSLLLNQTVKLTEGAPFSLAKVLLGIDVGSALDKHEAVYHLRMEMFIDDLESVDYPIALSQSFNPDVSKWSVDIGKTSAVISAPLAQVLEAAKSVWISPAQHFCGVFKLKLTLATPNGEDLTAESIVNIEDFNETPVVVLETTTMDEDVAAPLPFRLYDSDVASFANVSESVRGNMLCDRKKSVSLYTFTLTMKCANCFFTSMLQHDATLNSDVIKSGSSTVVIQGNFSYVESSLQQFKVQGMGDVFGENVATIYLNVSDHSLVTNNTIEVSHMIPLSIRPINDPPLITVPSELITDQGEELFVSGIEIRDVDTKRGEVYTASLTCTYGNLQIVSATPELDIFVENQTGINGTVIRIRSDIDELRKALGGISYMPSYSFAGRDILNVIVTDADGAQGWASISIYVRRAELIPSLDLNPLYSEIMQDEVYNLSGMRVTDNRESRKGLADSQLQAEVRAVHGGDFEVQEIRTWVHHVDQIQQIALKLISKGSIVDRNASVSGGSFKLAIDLISYGHGIQVTNDIQYDACAQIVDERSGPGAAAGCGLGESVQSNIMSLKGLALTYPNISVTVSRNYVSLYAGFEWLVTFAGVPATIPPLMVATSSLLSSSAVMSVTVVTSIRHPGSSLGGSFSLRLGTDVAPAIHHNASVADMTRAIEQLDGVQAVAVSREPYGLDGGTIWRVTFFATSYNDFGELPLLAADSSSLTGGLSLSSLGGINQTTVIPPRVIIKRISKGVGSPRVFRIKALAANRNALFDLVLWSTVHYVESFSLKVTHPTVSNDSYMLGPIFATSVAQSDEEISGPYPPHSQTAGVESGQSIQSQLLRNPLIKQFAESVTVSKTMLTLTGHQASRKKVAWRITFINPVANVPLPRVSVVSSGLDSSSNVTAEWVQEPNRIGGEFQLSYGGMYTVPLPIDCSANTMKAALAALPTLTDATLGLGTIVVVRGEADRQGGYQWLIGLTSDSEIPYNIGVNIFNDRLTGIGATVFATSLRNALRGFGLRLRSSVEGILNLGPNSMLDWANSMSLGGSSIALTQALNAVQYMPPEGWSGYVVLVVSVSSPKEIFLKNLSSVTESFDLFGSFDSTAATALTSLRLKVNPIESLPVILWQGALLTTSSTFVVYEDIDTLLKLDSSMFEAPVATTSPRHQTLSGLHLQPKGGASSPFHVILLKCERGTISVFREAPTHGLYVPLIFDGAGLLVGHEDLSFGVSTDPGDTLMLVGDIAQLNVALATLKYQGSANFYGVDRLNITIGALSDLSTTDDAATAIESVSLWETNLLHVRVLAVNDPPIITLTKASVHSFAVVELEEDTEVVVGQYFAVSDVDFDTNVLQLGAGPLVGIFGSGEELMNYKIQATLSLDGDCCGSLWVDDPSSVSFLLGAPANGSAEIVLRGPYGDVLHALSSVRYRPRRHWAGIQVLAVSIDDEGSIGAGGRKSAMQMIVLNVTSVANAPIIHLPSKDILHCLEDMVCIIGSEACQISGSCEADVSSAVNMSIKSLSISEYDLPTAQRRERFVVRDASTYKNVITNDPLFSVTYGNPALQYYLQLEVQEESDRITSSIMNVTLRAHHGTLSLANVPFSIQFLYGSGLMDDRIELSGSLQDINYALSGLHYRPDFNWNRLTGGDQGAKRGIPAVEVISIEVRNARGMQSKDHMEVNIIPVNDPPEITVDSLSLLGLSLVPDQLSYQQIFVKNLVCEQWNSCPLRGLQVRDVDAGESERSTLLITLEAKNGSFVVDGDVNPYALSTSAKSLTAISGLLSYVVPSTTLSTALVGLAYSPFPGFFGMDDIIVSVNDMGNTGLCMSSLLNSSALNDDFELNSNACPLVSHIIIPVIVQQVITKVEIHIPLQIVRGRRGEDIPVPDVYVNVIDDDGRTERILIVTMSSSEGRLTLPTVLSLNFIIGDGRQSSLLKFSGTLASINAALRNLVFHPDSSNLEKSNGLAKIAIMAEDHVRASSIRGDTITREDVFVFVDDVRVVPWLVLPGQDDVPPQNITDTTDFRTRSVHTIHLKEDGFISLEDVSVRSAVRIDSSTLLLTLTVTSSHGVFAPRNADLIADSGAVDVASRLYTRSKQTIIFQGLMEQVNVALRDTVYIPMLNYFGADSLDFQLCLEDYSEERVCSSKILPLWVESVLDGPEWMTPLAPLSVNADSDFFFGGCIQLKDVDNVDSPITIRITVNLGTVSLLQNRQTTIKLLEGTGVQDVEMTLEANLPSLNIALQSLTYRPPRHWYSEKYGTPTVLSLYAEYPEAGGGSLNASAAVLLVVERKINHTPMIHVPGATYQSYPCESPTGHLPEAVYIQCNRTVSVAVFHVTEDTPVRLSDVTVEDFDDSKYVQSFLVVNISALFGYVSIPTCLSSGIRVLSGNPVGNNSHMLSVTGSLISLNRALLSLTYIPPTNYFGSDEIGISVDDMGDGVPSEAKRSNQSIPLWINSVEDEPTLVVPASTVLQHISEDTVLLLEGTQANDPDFFEDVNGRPTYSREKPYETTAPWNETAFYSQSTRMLVVSVQSKHGRVMFSSTEGILFAGLPSTTKESQRLSSYPAIGTVVQRDMYLGVDGDLGSSSGAPPELWWKNVTISGRLFQLNRALQQLLYRPDLNWNSELGPEIEVDMISFSISVVGAAKMPAEEWKHVIVRVHAVNDAPVLTIPGAVYHPRLLTDDQLSSARVGVNMIVGVENQTSTLSGITVRDVDMLPETILKVCISAHHGTVSITTIPDQFKYASELSNQAFNIGLSFEEGTGTYDQELVFTSSLVSANVALGQLTFQPDPNFNGEGASVTISVNDMGNTGVGGPKSDTVVLHYIIEQRNSPPYILTPSNDGMPTLILLDEGDSVRIDGAYNVNQYALSRGTFRELWVGKELWRIPEASKPFGSPVWGAGYLSNRARSVTDVRRGPDDSNIKFLTVFQDYVYFQADDGKTGAELWRTPSASSVSPVNSTVASLFLNILPGPTGSFPSNLFVYQGKLYFAADGLDLSWRMTYDHQDQCAGFRQSTFNPSVYFAVANSSVWDPARVYDCPPGYYWASTEEGYRLFPPGSASTEEMLVDGMDAVSQHAYDPLTYYGQCGWNGYTWGNDRKVRFRFSDSATTGAYKHAGKRDSFRPDLDPPNNLFLNEFAGVVCVEGTSTKARTGSELWVSDGTVEGTRRLQDINKGPQGSHPAYMTSFNGYMYFVATSEWEGRELWRTSGEPEDVQLVSVATDGIFPGRDSADPSDLTSAGLLMFFAATDGQRGREVWYVDPNNAGTDLVCIDLVRGPDSSNPGLFTSSGDALPVYFQATTSTSGSELWVSDGTGQGTVMVRDICPGSRGSNPQHLTWFRGRLFFSADDCLYGRELWTSDGTYKGTYMLLDIRGGSPSSFPSYFVSAISPVDGASYLYFTATDGSFAYSEQAAEGLGGRQLWRSDGTVHGTQRAMQRSGNDMYIDSEALEASIPPRLLVVDGALYAYGRFDTLSGAHWTHSDSKSDAAINEEAIIGVNQAAVIRDVDSPTLTVTLSVSAGFLVVEQRSRVVGKAIDNNPFSILILSARRADRALLVNAFRNLGHTVYSSDNGTFAVDTVHKSKGAVIYFDLLLVDLPLHPGWDGLQTIRMLRHRERENSVPNPTLVVACSDVNDVLGVEQEAISAGANVFLHRPQSWEDLYAPTGKLQYVYPNDHESRATVGAEVLERLHLRDAFAAFASNVMKKVYSIAIPIDHNIVTSMNPLNINWSSQLPFLNAETAVTGSTLLITGNDVEVNEALRSVFYVAPIGTRGAVNLSISVTDTPLGCRDLHIPASWLPSEFLPYNGSISFIDVSLCDEGVSNSVSSIVPIFVTAVNRPPQIIIFNTAFTVAASQTLLLNGLSVTDPDLVDFELMTDKPSVEGSPPITVTVGSLYGRVAFPVRDGISTSTLFDRGSWSRAVQLRGDMTSLNRALATATYSCEAVDGCGGGVTDTITVTVDDEGYSGRGGPLTASETIRVTIL